MNTILIIIMFLAVIFYSNSVVALIFIKGDSGHKKGFFPSWVLMLGAIAMFFCMVSFLILALDYNHNKNKQENPKYEIVTERLYKQIK